MAHRVAVLGASGYVGAELVRLIATHPSIEIAALSADRKAGQAMAAVFPHLRHLDLPTLVTIGEIDLGAVDLVFCALPHGTTQPVIRDQAPVRRLTASAVLRRAALSGCEISMYPKRGSFMISHPGLIVRACNCQ